MRVVTRARPDDEGLGLVARQGLGAVQDFGPQAPTTLQAVMDGVRATRERGYSITTDTYSTAVTWAGRGLIASRTVKVVFVLDSATLHACEIGAA